MRAGMKRAAALLGLAATLGGCAYVGPRALESTRPRYNEAIANTNDQELLLNLVRIATATRPTSRASSGSQHRSK